MRREHAATRVLSRRRPFAKPAVFPCLSRAALRPGNLNGGVLMRPPPFSSSNCFLAYLRVYRSVQETHGSTDAWMIAMSPSAWPCTIARIAGMLTSDGVRIFTRTGVSEPSLCR